MKLLEWWRDVRQAKELRGQICRLTAEVARWRGEAHQLYMEEISRLERRSDGARCGHARQLTAEGKLLPCAWPGCTHGTDGPMWRVALLAPAAFWWRLSDEPNATPVKVAEYERREAYAGPPHTRAWFWVLR